MERGNRDRGDMDSYHNSRGARPSYSTGTPKNTHRGAYQSKRPKASDSLSSRITRWADLTPEQLAAMGLEDIISPKSSPKHGPKRFPQLENYSHRQNPYGRRKPQKFSPVSSRAPSPVPSPVPSQRSPQNPFSQGPPPQDNVSPLTDDAPEEPTSFPCPWHQLCATDADGDTPSK